MSGRPMEPRPRVEPTPIQVASAALFEVFVAVRANLNEREREAFWHIAAIRLARETARDVDWIVPEEPS